MSSEATSITLDEELLRQAKALGVDISRAAEAGVGDAVREARKARWRAKNRAAIESANDWIRANGLPPAQWRSRPDG